MIQDDFDEDVPNMEYQMQNSHQTYNYLNEFGHSGKNSGKKSSVMTSYPVSQQHMTHSNFGVNINPNQQEQQRTPSLHNPEPRTSSSSKQQFTIYQL